MPMVIDAKVNKATTHENEWHKQIQHQLSKLLCATTAYAVTCL